MPPIYVPKPVRISKKTISQHKPNVKKSKLRFHIYYILMFFFSSLKNSSVLSVREKVINLILMSCNLGYHSFFSPSFLTSHSIKGGLIVLPLLPVLLMSLGFLTICNIF